MIYKDFNLNGVKHDKITTFKTTLKLTCLQAIDVVF